MTTIDLVLAGQAGHAERTDPIEPAGRAVVDDWTLSPYGGGEPVTMVISDVRVPEGVYAVTVASVHPLQVHLRLPMCVDGHAQARDVAQQLARHVTTGALPFRPTTDEDRLAWRTLITMLARLTRDTITTPLAQVTTT
jgi:hypothetical protein